MGWFSQDEAADVSAKVNSGEVSLQDSLRYPHFVDLSGTYLPWKHMSDFSDVVYP